MANEMTFEEFNKYLQQTAPKINSELEETIALCCDKVRSDIQYSMAHTQRDMTRSYYTNNRTKAHHPSLPGNPPARDTGNLTNSIRWEIHNEGKEVYGIVGSSQLDENYAVYTEYGTTKMAPRPWLRPAMEKNNEWIRKSIANAVARTFQGVGK